MPSPCDVHVPGFARSLGLQLPDGQRREWIKPIMFSGGIGSMEAEHVSKEPPETGKSPPPLSRSRQLFPQHMATAGVESQWFVLYLPAPVSSPLDRLLR